ALNQTSSPTPAPSTFARIPPVLASRITNWGAAVCVSTSTLPVHRPPATSQIVLQPTSRFSLGPNARPAGEQNFIVNVACTLPPLPIRRTPPTVGFAPILGIER